MPKVLQNEGDAGSRRSRRRCRCSRGPATAASATRRVAILVADGVDGERAASARRAARRRRRGAALRRPAARQRRPPQTASRSRSTRRWTPRRRCCSTRSCCRTAPTPSQRWPPTAGAGVRQGPVPPLQADPGARRGLRAARQGRHSARRCRRASPIRAWSSPRPATASGRSTAFIERAGRASPLRARDRSAAASRARMHQRIQDERNDTWLKPGTLHDAFIDELRDAYDAEKQLIKALPKMAKAASSPELRSRLRDPPRGDARAGRAARAGVRQPRREGPRQALRRHRRHHRRRQVGHGRRLRRRDDGRLPDRGRPARRALRDGGLRHAGRVGAGDGPHARPPTCCSRPSTKRRPPTRS